VQALAILFGAIVTVATCYALGSRILGSDFTDPGARFVTGAAAFSLLMFGLCAAGLVYPASILAICAAALWSNRRGPWWPRPDGAFPYRSVILMVLAVYFICYFFNSMAPESSFDGSAYHLSLVARYLREHGFHPITWNLYASLPDGVEMLFLAAFAFGRHSAAAMVHFAFLLALAWQVFAYGRGAGSPLAGACGAAIVFCSPLFGVDGTSAYVDVAAASAAFTLFHLLQAWKPDRSRRLLWVIGIVAGFCYAIKYNGWIAVPYALGFVAWKSRRWRDAAVVALAASILVLPWMLKNWIFVGNPLAPFFNRYFPNPHVTAAFESSYIRQFALYDLSSRWQIPIEVTTYGRLGGLLGPIFLLSPFALLALRRREGRQLLLAAAVFGAQYFTNIGARFLLPSAVFIALALAFVLVRVPRLAVAVVLVHAVISWPTRIHWYCAPSAWHLSKVPWRQALRIKPPDPYLEASLLFYDVARMIDRNTPPDATVFTYRPIPEAYTSRRILVGYQAEENQIAGLMLQAAYNPELGPTLRLRFPFPRQALSAIRLVQTGTSDDQWKIHEVRLFDGRLEREPDGRWRLSTQPRSWTVGDAFDGRPITLWRCAETMRPGQWVEAVFPQPMDADAVLVETAPGQSAGHVKLEGRDASGAWKLLTAAPEITGSPLSPDLRGDAVRELRQRGIGYLLSFENEPDTLDLRRNQELYNIREVAHNQGTKLYQLTGTSPQ
jgi:hypothetical protein